MQCTEHSLKVVHDIIDNLYLHILQHTTVHILMCKIFHSKSLDFKKYRITVRSCDVENYLIVLTVQAVLTEFI